jgi:hypothetical protein
MHFLRPSDCVGCGFGQAKVAHLALVDELGHGTNCVLDWCSGINSVLIVEVDHIDLQPAQGCVASRAHVVWLSIDTDKGTIRPPNIAELGGGHDLVTAILNGFSDQLSFRPIP